MPELPEVETVVQDLLKAGIAGSFISDAKVACPKVIAELTAEEFLKNIINRKIITVSRRAKFIVFTLDGQFSLLIHLRMTGHLFLKQSDSVLEKHEHIALIFNDGRHLTFWDMRGFGRIYLTKTPQKLLSHLGVEPLEKAFSLKYLERGLQSRRKIKPLLLDQSFICGIGNIYADEALWQAGIHPETSSNTLDKKQQKNLHAAIIEILKNAIANRGTSLNMERSNFSSIDASFGKNSNFLKTHNRKDLPCYRCKTKIIKIKVAQRGTYLCPNCQNHS